MHNLIDYTRYDGLALADLVKKKEITPKELVDDALTGIEAMNGTLNGVATVLHDQVEQALATDIPKGPFEGVPFLVKEIVLHLAGAPCRLGSKLAETLVPETDTELMARFRRAGLITVGTTTTPEFGFNPTCESVFYGPSRNPWNTERSTGGSSGGSAAMVAARVVPLAHANDGGGSIRIPASCCGLVGLKPTRNRVPSGPDYGEILNGLAVELCVSRSVRDTAALLDAVAGADVGAPNVITPPARPYLEECKAKPGKLRIAWTANPISGVPVHPEVVEGLHKTVGLLESLGHEVSEAGPDIDWPPYFEALVALWTANNTWSIDAVAKAVGREPSPDNLERVTYELYRHGKEVSATELLDALDEFNRASRATGRFFENHDLLLTPTIAHPPLPLGQLDQNAPGIDAREWTRLVFEWVPFTPLFNSTGQPAISLPLHWSNDGLPIGMQFAGSLNDEAGLIRIAAQLEEAQPWADKVPPTHYAV